MKTFTMPVVCDVARGTGKAALLGVSTLALSAAGALAQQTSDTVTVIGERAQELSSLRSTAPILDTPQTVTVISSELMREQGARTLTEVLRNTPGISFNAGENGFSTSTNNFQLRGIDSSGSVFIDNARDSGAYGRDVFNIEAVEVVKGAASDNGRGAAGGFVNMVTKTPTLQNFTRAEAGFGFDDYDSDPRARAAVDVNQAVSGVGFRLNAMVENSGVAGRDIAERKAFGVAPSVAIGLGTPFRATLAFEYFDQEDLPEWGVPGATIEGLVTYNPATAGASRDSFYGLSSDFDDVEANSVLFRLEHDLSPGFVLANQTRYAKVERFARYTVPTGYTQATNSVTTQTQFYVRENSGYTNTTNLSAAFSTGAVRHNAAIGVEFSREESDALRAGTVNPPATPLLAPNPNRSRATPFVPTETNDVLVDTFAIYAYDTLELSPQFEITGGVRLEDYNVRIQSRTVAGAAAGALANLSDSEFTVGGRVGVVYKPVQNASIYASFGVSALPPGSYLSNPDISRTGDNAFPGFVSGAKPIYSHNYEVGGKYALFNERLLATAALFRTEKRNTPITGLTAADAARPAATRPAAYLVGYGEQIVQGVELGLSGQITDAWTVFGGIAYIDSERSHDPALDVLRRNADPNDYRYLGQAANPLVATTTNGDELAFTPNVTANLWTTYELPFGLTVGGGAQYVSESWLGRPDDAGRLIPNGVYGKLPSYFIASLMASYDVTEQVTLRANVDNVFDETYAVTTNWNASRATLGAPRTYRISADVAF